MKYIKKKIDANLMAKAPTEYKRLTGGGLFQEFEWMPDAYENCKGKIKLILLIRPEEQAGGEEAA